MRRIELDKVKFEEFQFQYAPEHLKKRIHDHEKHRDDCEPIGELEKNALAFFFEDCLCIGEEQNGSASQYFCDEDLMCLYYAIHQFMETGSREDAFNVYYCYIDIYMKSYEENRKLIEMLSNFENTAGNLVLKHRDHYSHSVYVFVTGLAIFHCNTRFREVYQNMYWLGLPSEEAALRYLKFWGVTALFHDVGYPFEIPFEQIKSYFVQDAGKERIPQYPFVSFRQMDYIDGLYRLLSEKYKFRITNEEYSSFVNCLLENTRCAKAEELTVEDVIACHIARRLSERNYSEAVDKVRYIRQILLEKATNPEKNEYYMDHALFSCLLLFRKMVRMGDMDDGITGGDNAIFYSWMDSFTAIVMHNVLFKKNLRRVLDENGKGIDKPLGMEEHPLAYMLMLCDELQCWNRTAYGKDSKAEFHAMDCSFQFEKNGDIRCVYIFETDKNAMEIENGVIKNLRAGTFKKFYMTKADGNVKKIMDVSDDKGKFHPQSQKPETWEIQPGSEQSAACLFYTDIEELVDLTDLTGNQHSGLLVGLTMQPGNRYQNHSFSDIRLISIYDYARKLYESLREKHHSREKTEFDGNPLSVKLAYISLIKNMGENLDAIGVFFTDTPKGFSQLHYKDFSIADKRYLTFLEEERQNEERLRMFQNGITYEYSDYLNEDPGRVAAMYREIFSDEENMIKWQTGSKNRNRIHLGEETVEISAAVEQALIILDMYCNLYYLPNKLFLEPDYEKQTLEKICSGLESGDESVSLLPDRVLVRNLNGRVVKEYPQEELFYERKPESVEPGFDNVLELVHVKDYYVPYPMSKEDDRGEVSIFSCRLGEARDSARLKLELGREEDEEEILWYEEGNGKIRQRIDKTMYFFEQKEEKQNAHSVIYFRQRPEGCLDIRSWMTQMLTDGK